MYKYVFFDMDGTVLNTINDIVDAVNYTLRTLGYPEHTPKEIRYFTGNAARHLMTKACPEGADIDEALSVYSPYYQMHCNDTTKPYDGIVELMEKLKSAGVKFAIVSNKMDPAVKELAKKWFPDLPSAAIGEMSGLRRKPYPDLVMKAMEELGADASESVYVGDTDVDILTAKNSGLACIAVTWGFREKDEIINLGADLYCDNCDEVYKAIIEH